jgi:hypothetical protein
MILSTGSYLGQRRRSAKLNLVTSFRLTAARQRTSAQRLQLAVSTFEPVSSRSLTQYACFSSVPSVVQFLLSFTIYCSQLSRFKMSVLLTPLATAQGEYFLGGSFIGVIHPTCYLLQLGLY